MKVILMKKLDYHISLLNINEGGYTKNVEIDFNHKEKTALVNNKKKEVSELEIKMEYKI